MSAGSLFQPPTGLHFSTAVKSGLAGEAVVIGIAGQNESKAYPVRYLAYHHQVYDSIDGIPVLVTYCSVCRSGRVYEATVNGVTKGHLRLVGMTRYNAMFEDAATGSWWMQATGESVAGPLKGSRMKAYPSYQMSMNTWEKLHPGTQLMLPDPAFVQSYDTEGRFEKGESKGHLTRADRGSWKDKSWVAGVVIDNCSRAYDWNHLMVQRIINDTVCGTPVAVVLASDNISLVAFQRPDEGILQVRNDTLYLDTLAFDLSGNPFSPSGIRLKAIPVYQEHWHSWKQFHGAGRYHESKP
jgi:hypothetical protein